MKNMYCIGVLTGYVEYLGLYLIVFNVCTNCTHENTNLQQQSTSFCDATVMLLL